MDISVGGLGDVGNLGGATKSTTMITERWETPTISGTRVPITTNWNNLALAPPPFTSPRLNIDMGMLTPVSLVAPHHRSGSLSSLSYAARTTPRPQVPPRGQKIHRATPEPTARPFNNTQDLNLYKEFLAVDDDDDNL